MRKISTKNIELAIEQLALTSSYDLPQDVEKKLTSSLRLEKSALGKTILQEILENAQIARSRKIPICQDTGFAIIFLEIGQNVAIVGDLQKAVVNGIKKGYKMLRKSIVKDPFDRENTNDNTPPSIHYEITKGDELKITFLPKGGGAENASFLQMLLPTASRQEVSNIILENVVKNVGKACPPVIIGIGIGGTFDTVAMLAKKGILRGVNHPSKDPKTAKMEKELLAKINKTNIGPMGLGGIATAIAVNIETAPCHIASLPIAVNFQCHAHRVKSITL